MGSNISSVADGVCRKKLFIGKSEPYQRVIKEVRRIAPRDTSVLITGQTGTGKEVVSRLIHNNSIRKDAPFVPVDCTTLHGQLFESQLFGHVKGAFTGATYESVGFFRTADSGTILLDEIGELDLEFQAKLLRVLQERIIIPVGSNKPVPVNVRVICATNRDLKQMVREGKFRADLYFRISTLQLRLPPLKDRKTDIIPLAEFFVERQADFYEEESKKLSARTKSLLMDYHWPGNVRELANVIEQGYVMSDTDVIDMERLPESLFCEEVTSEAVGLENILTIEQAEKLAIRNALNASGGVKTEAARILGLNYRTLMRMLSKYSIEYQKA